MSQIKNISFRKGLSNEIEIISIADTVSKHRNNIALPHRDNYYNIFWYQKGSANHLVDFKPIQIKENSLLFVNKNRVQTLDSDGDYDGKFLLFTENFFDKYPEDIKYLRNNILFNDLLEEPVLNIEGNLSIISVFKDIEIELAKPNDTVQYHILHNLLHNLLLLSERERIKNGFNQIKKGADLDNTMWFRNVLEDKFKTIKTVAGYSSIMSMSERKLNKSTMTTLGKTAKELIHERIILEAKRMLAHTNSSIKEIGFELGFEEPTNFIKYFRKHEEKTPVEFRKLFQKKALDF